jgi:hypothetical protein
MASRKAVWGSPRDHRDLGVFAISSERRVDYERSSNFWSKDVTKEYPCSLRKTLAPIAGSTATRGRSKISGTVRGTLMAASVILRRSSRREWTLHSQSYRGP